MRLCDILKLWNFTCLFLLLSCPHFAAAEKVKPLNPDCDVCPVVISYDSEESRNLIGETGKNLISKLTNIKEKTVKIDLDGIKKTGSEKDGDDGYELVIFVYQHMVAINAVRDGSSIKLKTGFNHLITHQALDQWNPEIQLTPSDAHAIERSDPLALAWAKMRKSRMYDFINSSGDKWEQNLGQFLLMVLDRSLQE